MTYSSRCVRVIGLIQLFLAGAVCHQGISYGQSSTTLTPVPTELKQAVSLDLGGNSPLFGISYHRQLVQLTSPSHAYRASLDFTVGAGYIPTICLFSCNTGGPSTYHTLLLRWGRRLQGEVGYAGLLTVKGAIAQQAYLPGAVAGGRFTSHRWFVRGYMAGLFHHDDKTVLLPTGELTLQRTNLLALLTGLSIGKRF